MASEAASHHDTKWSEACGVEYSGTAEGCWRAFQIWLSKPHVINRRLCGSRDREKLEIATQACPLDVINVAELRTLMLETNGIFTEAATSALTAKLIKSPVGGSDVDEMQSESRQVARDEPPSSSVVESEETKSSHNIEVMVRDLLPKRIDRFGLLRELVLLDKLGGTAVFIPLMDVKPDDTVSASQDLCYAFKVDAHNHRLLLYTCGGSDSVRHDSVGCSEDWLKTHLLKRFAQWSSESSLNTEQTSLRLISVCRYNELYQELKQKYGLKLVQNWPESTDPQKFVFEDIATAAYLITLWEEERQGLGSDKKQSFVDLGCGNGLLVHLLALEGYEGIGIDIRKRGIWEMYGPETKLIESSITPSDQSLFPQYDWLIGNHSDELTPWIPVMAARSSYTCRYFVLPCCAHDFDSKFSQKRQGLSQYQCYLEYVVKIGKACGFNVDRDVLRIPSTKRVCFIGKSRTYPQEEEGSFDSQRKQFIDSHCKSRQSFTQPVSQSVNTHHGADAVTNSNSSDNSDVINIESHVTGAKRTSDQTPDAQSHAGEETSEVTSKRCRSDAWASEFSARPAEDKVRNCKAINSGVKDTIMMLVFNKLLEASDMTKKQLTDGRMWNSGGSPLLSDVAAMIDGDLLKQLKNECGGLQTLLRNCNHIFRVQGGRVYIRAWDEAEEYQRIQQRMKKKKGKAEEASQRFKTRLCWLHDNHPDGCPRVAADCTFAHGEDELRSRDINSHR